MHIIKGTEGCKETWQDDFPAETKCPCGGQCQIAFTAIEGGSEAIYVSDMRDDDATLWPHDAIAVAVYICKKCMKPKALMNQA